MASHGRAAPKPKGGAASGTFRSAARDEGGALVAVRRLVGRSPGRPLDDGTRNEMEALFGHDFGQIRVHTDDAAAEAAETLGADAFTIGDDVYFAEGAYRPGDAEGDALLAHELAHTVQRDAAFAGAEVARVSGEDDAIEREAEAMARDALRGFPIEAERLASAGEAARTIARRATQPSKRKKPRPLAEPTPPLGETSIVDRLVGIVLGNFWKDPEDKAGRVRRQLGRLSDETRAAVVAQIDARLADADKRRFSALLATEAPPGTEVSTPAASDADTSDRELRDAKTPAEAKEAAKSDDAKKRDAKKRDARNEAEGKDAESAREADKGEKKDESGASASGLFGLGGAIAGALAKAFGKAEPEAKKEEGAKKEGKAEEGKEGGKDEGPEKPKLADGEGEGAQGEKAEGAPGAEAGGGAGAEGGAAGGAGAEAPAGGGSADASVDVGPFDALLAKKQGAKPAGGMPGTPAIAGGAPGGGVIAEAAPAGAAEAETSEAGEPSGAEAEIGGAEAQGGAGGGAASGEAAGAGEAKSAEGGAEGEAEEAGEENATSEANEASAKTVPTQGAPVGPPPSPPPEATSPEGDAEEEEASTSNEGGGEKGREAREAPEPAEGAAPSGAETSAPAAVAPEAAPAAANPAAPAAPTPEAQPPAASAPSASQETEPPALPEAPATEASEGDATPEAASGAEVGGGAGGAEETTEAPPGAAADAGDVGASADAGGEPDAGSAAPVDASADVGGDAGGGGDVGAGGGGAGGGGGGGSPIEAKPPPAPPDVSASSPSQAMAAMAGLPPATLLGALGGVATASNRAVGEERAQAAANPPQVERPSGAPAKHPPAANAAELAAKIPTDAADKVDKVPAGEALAPPQPAPPPELAPPPPLPSPVIAGDAKISAENAAEVQAAADNLPTTDPELNVTAGDAPELELAGDADPAQAKEQREKLDTSVDAAKAQGAKDAAQPMGETEVYPDTPAETLKATIPSEGGGGGAPAAGGEPAQAGGAGGGGAGGGGGGDVDQETASIVAEERQGDEIRATVEGQSSEMGAKKAAHDEKVQTDKDATQKQIDDAIEADAQEQEGERGAVQKKVAAHRKSWNEDQKDAVESGNEKANKANSDADAAITTETKKGRTEAKQRIDDGNKEIGDARKDAESKAKSEQKKAKTETSSGGFFDWLGSKVKSFFNAIKSAIKSAFDFARKLVKAAIKKAQELAVKAIEAARKAVVAAIHAVGDALIAIGDVVLAAFPEAREKYKKLIQDGVQAAEDTVNKLAEGLKKTVVAALDLLGKAIDAYLGLLEKALLAAVDVVSKLVQGAIAAAKAIAQALAAFAVLIKDVAAAPGKWIRNLGASVIDGIRNHFVKAFKAAIKEWFNSTVEQVLGLGKAVIAVLKKGGLPWAKIGKMAWEALKSAIPMMLIELLIEKLVAMLVPAAAAVMAIIQGLQAAWGAVQRIIAAFELFFKFLKAVKNGNAGPQFADALAAAAIVVIQFVAFWLLRKLIKPASKVGAKLKEIAKKIGAALKKVGKALVKGAKAVGGALKKGLKAVGKGLKKGVKAIGKGLKKVGEKIKNSKIWKKIAGSKLGKKIKAGYEKARAKVKEWKEKAKKKYEDWKKRRAERRKKAIQKRFEKGVAAVERLIASTKTKAGMRAILFRARLAWIKLRYRFTKLERGGSTIHAVINPSKEITDDAQTIEIDKVQPSHPAGENESSVSRDFALSRSGNNRLFAFKPPNTDTRRYVFHVTGQNKGFWNGLPVNEDVTQAEAAARQRLQSEKTNYVSLVPPTKDPSAPGFDVAGVGASKTGGADRLTLGEVKVSSVEKGRWFSAREVTALTGRPLETNLNKLVAAAQAKGDLNLIKRIQTSIVEGNVDFVIYLAKEARLSPLQRLTLKIAIRRDLIRYLSAPPWSLARAQIARAVRNVSVPDPIRL